MRIVYWAKNVPQRVLFHQYSRIENSRTGTPGKGGHKLVYHMEKHNKRCVHDERTVALLHLPDRCI
jgi:hypothetical protein